jgi:hypothetical protein
VSGGNSCNQSGGLCTLATRAEHFRYRRNYSGIGYRSAGGTILMAAADSA